MAEEVSNHRAAGYILFGKKLTNSFQNMTEFLLFSTKNVLTECDSYVKIVNDKRWIVTGKAGYTTLYH